MCRLVGVVASEITQFGLVLKEAPRSLARLSSEHPDGWGIAAHGGPDTSPPSVSDGSVYVGGWRVQKGTERASECKRFLSIAERSAGTVLIAHVRQKTVGPTRIANTHPFMRGRWVFAHNGTIRDQAYVRERTSERRLAEIQGDTDSEVLFAFLLSRLDAEGLTSLHEGAPAREEATDVLSKAAAELREKQVGAFNFLLSDGDALFVHRFGRSLFMLERTPPDDGSQRDLTKFRQRKPAALVASERLTDEPWIELPEGAFLRIDREPTPTIARRIDP